MDIWNNLNNKQKAIVIATAMLVLLFAMSTSLLTENIIYKPGPTIQYTARSGATIKVETVKPTTFGIIAMSMLREFAIAPGTVYAGTPFNTEFSFNNVDGRHCNYGTIDDAAINLQVSTTAGSGLAYSDSEYVYLGKISGPFPKTLIKSVTYTFPNSAPTGSYEIWGKVYELQSGDKCYAVSDEDSTSVQLQGQETSQCLDTGRFYTYHCINNVVYKYQDTNGDNCPQKNELTYVKDCPHGCVAYSNSLNDICTDDFVCTPGEFKCVEIGNTAQIQMCSDPDGSWLLYGSYSGTCKYGSGNDCDGTVSDCVLTGEQQPEQPQENETTPNENITQPGEEQNYTYNVTTGNATNESINQSNASIMGWDIVNNTCTYIKNGKYSNSNECLASLQMGECSSNEAMILGRCMNRFIIFFGTIGFIVVTGLGLVYYIGKRK